MFVFKSSENGLPDQLVPELLTRFSSAEGYALYPDVLPFFKALRQTHAPPHQEPARSKPIIGIITNSDDRVPSILSSFGLQVGLLRHNNNSQASFKAEDDVNFVITSYEVGCEKPDSGIFDTTKQMLRGQERFLHIGDDLQKDYYAAKKAGWESILLDREASNGGQGNARPIPRIANLQELMAHIGRLT